MKPYHLIVLFAALTVFSCSSKTTEPKETEPESRSTIISADEINEKIKYGKPLYYENAVIRGDIDFTIAKDKSIETPSVIGVYVKQSVLFSNCSFQGKVIAARKQDDKYTFCRFEKSVSFSNCTFQKKADFTESQFDRLALFRYNIFQDTVIFEGAFFKFKNSYFHNSTFIAPANFNRTVFNGKASFIKSDFHDHAHFQDAVFEDDVNFGALTVREKSDFSLLSCRGHVNFSNSYFYAACDMVDSRFFDKVQWDNIKAEQKININDCVFYFAPNKENLPDTGILSVGNARFIENSEYKSLY